jgi:hypothetical protein
VDEEGCLRRYGLRPLAEDIEAVRELLSSRVVLERSEQGLGDTLVMRLCCVQLFNVGDVGDVLLIWQAKESSWDAHCSIDVQLLCGSGLEETKAHLVASDSNLAAEAVAYLLQCEAAGDFADFSVHEQSLQYAAYYAA